MTDSSQPVSVTSKERWARAREAFARWHVSATIELPDDQKWLEGYVSAITDLGRELAEARTHHDILHPNCDAELQADGIAPPDETGTCAPPQRYRVQQDKGEYCLKGCADGDLVDYSAYEALLRRFDQPPHLKAPVCVYCEAGMQKVKEDLHYDAATNSSHRCTANGRAGE
jgi:hypothetical protein